MKEQVMLDIDRYIGAKWMRVDLHLHSPCVESFRLPNETNLDSKEKCEELADEYVRKIEEANISIGAITDYNGIEKEWFDLIKNKAQEREIELFPGVELSLKSTGGKYGLHLLLIFEQDIEIDGLNTFLHSLDKNPQKPLISDRKHRNIDCTKELEKLINNFREKYNCLIIIPHPENSKGLLKSFSADQAAQYLKNVKPDAIEYISDKGIQTLISTGILPSDYFKKIAIIENTDPKCLTDIIDKKRETKSRATYYKLSSVSIGSLKIALHDPEVRVSMYTCPSFYHDRIKRMTICGSSFLKNMDLFFNPELNTLIGGRGVGKSAIIETIRYAMDLPIYAEKSSRIDFVESVIGYGGEISLIIERYFGKEKKEFVLKRIVGKELEILDMNGKNTGLPMQGIFEEAKYPIIIGQKELYFLSITSTFQLTFIDELIGETIWAKKREFRKLIEQLKENGNKILVLKEKVSKKEEYYQRLKEINAKLKIYEDLGVEKKLRRWTHLVDDEEKLLEGIEKLNELSEETHTFFEESSTMLEYMTKNLSQGKSENKSLLDTAAKEINQIKNTFTQVFDRLNKTLNQAMKTMGELQGQWNEKRKGVESGIRTIKNELADDGLKPDELEQLTKEKARLIPVIEELISLEKDIETMEIEREKLIDEIKKKRHDIFITRKKQLDAINDALQGRLKIEVKYEEDKKEFINNLKNILKGSKVSIDAVKSLAHPSNKVIDGLFLSHYIRGDEQELQEEFNLTPAMSNRIQTWFEDSKKVYALEGLFPEDKIEIFLKVNENYKIIDRLSIGQRATALLLLLFAQEDRIIVLDQPEEDLDNRFIYDDVVEILREMKGKRQFLIATHNANIPVLGDSELILVLDTKNQRCIIKTKGSIDREDIKTEVKTIMEGGETAFKIRSEKYGGI